MNDIEKRIEEIVHDLSHIPITTRLTILYHQLLKEELAKRDGQWAHELGKAGFDKSKFDSILTTLNKEKD